jgi:hypothetical protein
LDKIEAFVNDIIQKKCIVNLDNMAKEEAKES